MFGQQLQAECECSKAEFLEILLADWECVLTESSGVKVREREILFVSKISDEVRVGMITHLCVRKRAV